MKRSLCAILLVGGIMGCAQSGIRVVSEPSESDVFIVERGQAPVLLGKTPIRIKSQQFSGASTDGFQIEVQKEGFLRQTVFVPKINSSSKLEVFARLKEKVEDPACRDQLKALREVSHSIATAQNLMHRKQYGEAQLVVQRMLETYPSVSIGHDILGNIYYLRGQFSMSLEEYRKSLIIHPTNLETQSIVRDLEQRVGGRIPASTPTGGGE